ncbi:response regulator transcription factor [Mariluticola halotolerans]|uniref:response regulator transcription factor n=1 Tax=Mariluticola halotolerans TaxID=2909283 RepID=UPI0026E13FC3|nr:response regulator transcription factor [Mariluticola halotolerans]UJQ93919.1 response regulator transcription factor [Mariluticola halotolerans]
MSIRRLIKVLLVDDHPLVLEGIQAIIETYSHIEVVGATCSARKALDIATRTEPDVVMMDINMPELNGLDAIELFKEQLPNSRLLMLSMHDSREYISTSVMYGASGYVLKDVSTNEIIAAIDAVAAGGTYFSSGVSDVLMRMKDNQKPCGPLTTREQAVLLLVAEGKSSKDVAIQLEISARTVETHRKNIKKKLGISTTAGLTRYAIESGLIGQEI